MRMIKKLTGCIEAIAATAIVATTLFSGVTGGLSVNAAEVTDKPAYYFEDDNDYYRALKQVKASGQKILATGIEAGPNGRQYFVLKDSIKDTEYRIVNYNSKWYYEIKQDDGFTKLVGPYISEKEAREYFMKHRPNEKLKDKANVHKFSSYKIVEKLPNGYGIAQTEGDDLFYVFDRKQDGVSSMFSRIETITKRFGLENRIQNRDRIVEQEPVSNWNEIEDELVVEKNKSMGKLLEAMGI